MKPASTALLDLLATRQFYSADLYTITLVGGTVFYFCAGDADITHGGNLYTAGGKTGPYFDRQDNKAKCHWKLGIEVDTLNLDVIPGSSTINGQPFLSAVQQGVFDGAELQLERAFMPTFGNTAAGTVIMFVGRVAEVDAGRSLATFTINSHLELLNQNLPRNLYQSGCVNTLYDTSCGLNRGDFTVSAIALTGSTANLINVTLTPDTGYFDHGSVLFTSGANNGVSRSIKTHTHATPSTLSLLSPLPNIPSPGDTFTVLPGCDKAQGTCSAKFNNLLNFRGFPYVPDNSTGV